MGLNRQGNPVLGLVSCQAGPRTVDFTRALVLPGKAWGLRKRSEGEVQVRKPGDGSAVKISDLKSNTTDVQKPKKRLGAWNTRTEAGIFNLRLWRET